MAEFDIPASFLDFYTRQGMGDGLIKDARARGPGEQETTYDPYAYSDIGKRALGGEYIDSMNFFWFDPVTGEEGQTTEGWSRVPDSAKPYTYLEPSSRNQARNTFYESGAAFGGAGGLGGVGGAGGGLLSGQAYAQQIAGGMPFEQVVAPGMSFSPDQPMGYLAEGATPFQPRPTFFPSVQDPSVGMTGAELGLPMGAGTPMPAGTTFEGEPIRMPAPSVMGSPLPLNIDIDELLKDIDVEQAIENLPTPVATPQPVAAPVVSTPITPPVLPEIIPERQPVMPSMPIVPPVMEAPTPMVDVPMNLGLPMLENLAPVQIPEIPFQLPQIPQTLSMPTLPMVNPPVMQQPMVNLGMSPTNPVLSIDNIVSPIRQGSPRALLGTL